MSTPSSLFTRHALPWILGIEGGVADDDADPGGLTNLGITLGLLLSLPPERGDINGDGKVDGEDVLALRRETAGRIYHDYFWQPARCDECPPAVALCLFDGLVNHRPGPAKRLVQQALGVPADGVIGPATLAAAGRVAAEDFLGEYLSRRAEFYCEIIAADGRLAKFRRGWFRRLFLLQSRARAAQAGVRGDTLAAARAATDEIGKAAGLV